MGVALASSATKKRYAPFGSAQPSSTWLGRCWLVAGEDAADPVKRFMITLKLGLRCATNCKDELIALIVVFISLRIVRTHARTTA